MVMRVELIHLMVLLLIKMKELLVMLSHKTIKANEVFPLNVIYDPLIYGKMTINYL